MPIQSLSALSPEPRNVAETYLRHVAEALRGTDAALSDDLLADLESHMLERLDASATADEVSRHIAELGSPESFSAALGGKPKARVALGSAGCWASPTTFGFQQPSVSQNASGTRGIPACSCRVSSVWAGP